MSDRSCSWMFGRCTFTATRRPSCVVASCTCASDAAASGVGLNAWYSVSGGAPSDCATIARTSS